MFERAKWLWKSKESTENSYGWFRKSFDLGEIPEKAILAVSAHNHVKVYVNDRLVTGYVTPAPVNQEKTKPYVSHAIEDVFYVGTNVLDVVVLYLGGKGQNYVDAIPGFILSLDLDIFKQRISINSDATWHVLKHIPYVDGMPFQQSRRITPVEYYDDRIKANARNKGRPVVFDTRSAYRKQGIPEGAIHERIVPKRLDQDRTCRVYDVGKIMSGFIRIRATSSADVTLRIRYAEALDGKRVRHYVANEPSQTYYDTCTLKAFKLFDHAFDFTYKAFRYVEVEGDLSLLDDFELEAQKANTNIQIAGYLESQSMPRITRLFDMFKETQTNNTLGLLVDCPHREQAQYLGDSALQAESIVYNVIERHVLLEKVLQDFSDVQESNGSFPFVAPGNTKIAEFSLKIPEYDLYFIDLLEQRYRIDRDQSILSHFQETVTHLLDGYIARIDSSGLVRKNADWHIADWPYPTVDQTGDYLTFENMLLYRSLCRFIDLYDDMIDLKAYKKTTTLLKKRIVSLLKRGRAYPDHKDSSSCHQGIQAFALLAGLFDSNETEQVLDGIVHRGFSSSIIFSRYVLRALFTHGRIDEALNYIFEGDRGWGKIMDTGSKTMWEGFDDIESHSHAWGLYPVRMMQEYVLGIRMDESPGLAVVRPLPTTYMKDLFGRVVTEYGILGVGYEIHDEMFDMKIEIPNGLKVRFVYGEIDRVFASSITFSVPMNESKRKNA
jgi:alpha-L-rhamnosidase